MLTIFRYHPAYTPQLYMSPAYAWVRAHLKRNGYKSMTGDPPEVTRFLFYLELHNNHELTFRRTFTSARMNYEYFKEYETQGIASAGQKAFLRAVDEANDGNTWGTFAKRERFLALYCQKPISLHKPSSLERKYLNRTIANRMCRKLIQQLEDHVNKVHYMTEYERKACKNSFEYWIIKFAQLPVVKESEMAELRMEIMTDMLDQVGLN